ncbi:MAG: cobyric acid synthase, partial [Proteobacteria bacterium]|nr:cobyric acid synthase [Pseudomonadota bacterium]
ANMGFAVAADVPVVLVGDIDKGGVIASLVGTHQILEPQDRAMIRGYVINKFRGDVSLFDDGLLDITARTGWPSFGVVPWLRHAALLPAEDAVVLERSQNSSARGLKVIAPMLSRISNFDDLDPLKAEPDVSVEFLSPGSPIPADADLIVLLGTKSTVADMDFLRAQGWDIDIHAHVRRGGRVLGLCGGYQMLGRLIDDPDGVEGRPGSTPGLGMLEVETAIQREKTTVLVDVVDGLTGAGIQGYEIHAGQTSGPGCASPMLVLDGVPHGAISPDGRVMGCYLHGLFTSDLYRRAFLSGFGVTADKALNYNAQVDAALDGIAAALEEALDVDGLLAVSAARAGSV